MRLGRVSAVALFASCLLCAAVADAQVRQIETVGAYPLAAGGAHKSAARDQAVTLALTEAVMQVAGDLVAGASRADLASFLPDVIGNDPLDYTTRFRVIEDRGERPAMYSSDPKVEYEYVVLVESHIDSGRVREKLATAGLLAARPRSATTQQLLLVIEEADDYAAYEALRSTLIQGLRVKSVLPVEMQRGRIVLAIETSRNARQVLDNLLEKAPPGLSLIPLGSEARVLTLRIRLDAAPQTP